MSDTIHKSAPQGFKSMKCILHIGLWKTGTKTIQSWLYQNRDPLGQKRIFLSQILDLPNNRLLPFYFQRQLELDSWARGLGVVNTENKRSFFSGFDKKFQAEVEAAKEDHDFFFITSEHFSVQLTSLGEIKALALFLNRFFSEVKVICYFREQADLGMSLYSTGLRESVTKEPDTWLQAVLTPESYLFDYMAIADNWASVFGKSACYFRIYDRKKFFLGDIRKDLMKAVLPEVSLDGLDFSHSADKNQALSALEAILYQTINQEVPLFGVDGNGLDSRNQRLKERLSQLPGLRIGRLQSEIESQLRDSFRDRNREFFDKYFSGQYLFEEKEGENDQPESIDQKRLENVCREVAQALLRKE